MKRVVYFFVIFYSFLGYSQSSVLSSGRWHKIGITETGIHKIDRTTLDALGVGGQLDPRNFKLYGNGVSGILPQSNAEERPQDLLENAIFVSGENDGAFDGGDYILFYGIGPDKEEWSSEGFSFEKNIYSDTAYYFLKVDGTPGKRIESRQNLADSPDLFVSSFDDHIAFEEDENNLISSGRKWLGEIISNSQTYTNTYLIEGITSDINASLSVVSQSPEDAVFEVLYNSSVVDNIPLDGVPSGPRSTYEVKAREAVRSYLLPMDENATLGVRYNGNTANARGYIDRYTMTFKRELALYQTETAFRWIDNSGITTQYTIDGAGTSVVWNITDPSNIIQQEVELEGTSATFKSRSGDIEEFVVFTGEDFPTPFVFGRVGNQNLRGDTNYDALIITPPDFLDYANRLADFHRTHDNLSVKVALLREVYNEFSSGRQDITAIRDYAKYMYERGQLKYLLLFGDCSYDYKDRVISNTNFVPTYQSRESFEPIYSYSSDDYFGFFGDDEGEWVESRSGDHTMEIGVGRLPVKNELEAEGIVDKIIYYSTSPNTLGTWRNELTYLGDDGDTNIHAIHVEDLSELIDTTYAEYNISKLLVDAFEQEAGPSSDLSPQTSNALRTRIKNGTFSINFIGHGNERLWTEEEVLTRSMISELTNRNKLPIFVTATCEFGRYDDPFQTSGAEELLLSTKGGGIALLTTSRPVFASTNFELNQAFHESIFEKVNGANQRLGDIIRTTKNGGLAGAVNRNFTLLGDPMMLPAFPKLEIVLNEMTEELDTLSALEVITLSGQIQSQGTLHDGFNGRLIAGVFDVKQEFTTKGQESDPFTYSLRNNALFRGEAAVEDGVFEFSFVVPKNISYQFEKGKISMYAWDEASNIDAAGSSREFLIGGTSQEESKDTTAPAINMYLNDESFRNGGVVGNSPLLIANISDENGITTSRSGVVEGITLELNGELINLNEFYLASSNDYTSGTVLYPIQNLEPGNYSAEISVWDTHNNQSSQSIQFEVSDQSRLFIYNQIAFPNPVIANTTFYFEHDREDEDLLVELVIHESSGRVIYHEEYVFENSDRVIEIPWNASANGGTRLDKGIYYSRLIIKSNFDGATKEINNKLVIVN